MGKIQLRIPPWIASMLGEEGSVWFVLEKEIGDESTVGDLLRDLTASNANFRKAVFNPDLGKISDQLIVVINHSLLQGPDVKEVKLNDGDSVMLLHMYTGG